MRGELTIRQRCVVEFLPGNGKPRGERSGRFLRLLTDGATALRVPELLLRLEGTDLIAAL